MVPAALRKEMMAMVHASCIRIEGCIQRARETMFWPRMLSELEYISKCDVCMAHRSSQGERVHCTTRICCMPMVKGGRRSL